MARIISIHRESGAIGGSFIETACGYKSGTVNGEKLVVLSTYGSASRQSTSASQTLHIDEKTAKKLIEILKQEFSL